MIMTGWLTDGASEQDRRGIDVLPLQTVPVGFEELEQALREDEVQHLGDLRPIAWSVSIVLRAHRQQDLLEVLASAAPVSACQGRQERAAVERTLMITVQTWARRMEKASKYR